MSLPKKLKKQTHGTLECYKRGLCRCLLCKAANTEARNKSRSNPQNRENYNEYMRVYRSVPPSLLSDSNEGT